MLYLKIVVYTCIFEWYEFQSVFSYHYPVFSAKILVCLDVFSRNGSQSIRLFSSKRFKIIIRNMLWKSRNFREYSSLHILFKDQVYILYSQIDSSPEFLSRFFQNIIFSNKCKIKNLKIGIRQVSTLRSHKHPMINAADAGVPNLSIKICAFLKMNLSVHVKIV